MRRRDLCQHKMFILIRIRNLLLLNSRLGPLAAPARHYDALNCQRCREGLDGFEFGDLCGLIVWILRLVVFKQRVIDWKVFPTNALQNLRSIIPDVKNI